VPAAGIVTVRLVALGAMSPVSTLPSLNTMRWVTLWLFLNTTCWPPKDAGLGENACVPLWPLIVIVGPFVGEGAVDPLPPHANVVTKPRSAVALTNRNLILVFAAAVRMLLGLSKQVGDQREGVGISRSEVSWTYGHRNELLEFVAEVPSEAWSTG
jgi:hypothetical protein